MELSDAVNQYKTIVGGKWGYINKKGEEIFPAIFDRASSFEEKEANVIIKNDSFRIYYENER